MQFIAEFVLCFLKLFDRLSHTARQLRQFLCSEKQQDEKEDEQQIAPGK
jgi:hypothetical protein